MSEAEDFGDFEEHAVEAAVGDPAFDDADPHGETAVHVTTREERRRAFTILFLSVMCLGTGQSVLYGILPSLIRALHLTEFDGSLPVVTSATIWVFTSGFWGKRSDHWGRKPVILIGLSAFGISFGLFGAFGNLATTGVLPVFLAFPAMIVSRSLYGIFGAGASPAAQAYVADRTTRAERTQGVAALSGAFGLGTTIGPCIGATVLVVLGLFAPFYLTAVMALASAAAIWLFLPERTAPRLQIEKRYHLHWHDRRIWPFIVFGLGISTLSAIPVQTIGYLLIDVLHLKLDDAPQYIMIGLVAMSLAGLFVQFVVVQRFDLSARTLMRWGSIVTIASFLLFVVSRQFGPLIVALIVSGVGFGMVRPGYAASASLAVDPHEQGAIAGLTGATSGAGFIFGPLIATSLYRIAPTAPYIFGAAMTAILYVYALVSPHLRNAGLAAPDSEVVEEAAETQVPNA